MFVGHCDVRGTLHVQWGRGQRIGVGCAHSSQCYRRRGQADEPAIPGVRLVDRVGVVVAELVDDLGDAVMVVFGEGVADDGFESAARACQFCICPGRAGGGRRRCPPPWLWGRTRRRGGGVLGRETTYSNAPAFRLS